MRDINIFENGSVNLMIFSICMVAVIGCIIALIWLIFNWLEYRKKINDVKYRKKNGLFNIGIYADRTVSAYVSRYQVNKGPDPENFDKDIPCINFFENVLDVDK